MNISRILAAIAILVFLVPGCGDLGGNPPGDTGENNDAGDVANNDSDTDANVESSVIRVTLPDMVSGLEDDVQANLSLYISKEKLRRDESWKTCATENACEFTFDKLDEEYTFWVTAAYERVPGDPDTATVLFVDKAVPVSPETGTVDVHWGQPGEWGLAPSGFYQKMGNPSDTCEVFSEIVSPDQGPTQVYIAACGREAIISGDTFTGEMEGTISHDLATIELTREVDGETESFTLQKMQQ
jgi:hypothetical protein